MTTIDESLKKINKKLDELDKNIFVAFIVMTVCFGVIIGILLID